MERDFITRHKIIRLAFFEFRIFGKKNYESFNRR